MIRYKKRGILISVPLYFHKLYSNKADLMTSHVKSTLKKKKKKKGAMDKA